MEINGYKTKPEWFLGKGSFGSVYKAEKDGKFYAIKIFQTELLKDEYKKFLDREVAALKKIDHPQVVKFYESGIFADKGFDYFYIVMDFVEGDKLSTYIGTGDEKTIVDIIKSIISTLDFVHKKGILHRDLKPDNIVVTRGGKPVLLDFGLSKLIDYTSIIQTGEHVGTFHYMSPEQISDSKNIDSRSDYFSIGTILYQLLTGILPFDAPNLPALIFQIQNRYPRTPSDVNPSISNQVENIILKLLEKQPHARYQKASEIIDAFSAKPVQKKKRLNLEIKNYIRLLNTDKRIFQEAFKKGFIENTLYPANLFARFHPTVRVITDTQISFTTDPSTNRLAYPAFTKTLGVQELPYSSGEETTPIQKKNFSSIGQVQDYVKKVIDFQIKYGVNELAAPFFYAKDPTDEWFSINLKLLKEATDFRDTHYPDMPLWAGICMNVNNWYDDDVKNEILNKYVKHAPDGIFVYGDPIGSEASLPIVFHYADLLLKLQQSAGVPVVAARVNGLGLILLAAGISGISSGVAGLDSFREDILSSMTEIDYVVEPRYYIPELMTMIQLKGGITTKLKALRDSSLAKALGCGCPYCRGVTEGDNIPLSNIKLHFLFRRFTEIKELQAVKQEKRLEFIEDKINKAIGYERILAKAGVKITTSFSHLNTWKSLVEQLKKKS